MTTGMADHYVHDLSPYVIRFTDSFAVHWYGLAYVLGFYLCYLVMRHLARRGLSELKADQAGDFITLVAIFGVVLGGRLGFMLMYNFDEFVREPWILFLLWKGGMASHGGILGVILFTLWYAKKHRISWTGLGDTVVCGAPLGILLGRLANFINGELYGRITTVPWAVKFPTEALSTRGDLPPEVQHSPDILEYVRQTGGDMDQFIGSLHPRHPSQLYEAAGEGLFLFLFLFTARIRFPSLPNGTLTGLFFVAYAVIRIALESCREPDSSLIAGITKGQFYSVFMIVIGLAFLAFAMWKGRVKTKEGS